MASKFETLGVSEFEGNPSDEQFCVEIHRDAYDEVGPEHFWSMVNEIGEKRKVPSAKLQDQTFEQVKRNLVRGKPVTRDYQFYKLWETLSLICCRAPQGMKNMFELTADQGRLVKSVAGAFLNDAWERLYAHKQGEPGFDYFMRGQARLAYHILKTVEKSDTPNWFSISEDLATALLVTDLASVKSEDLHLPFPGLYIEPPSGVISVKEANSDRLLDVEAINIVEETFESMTEWTATADPRTQIQASEGQLVLGRRLSIALISAPTEESRRSGEYDFTTRYLSVPLAEGRDIQDMLEQEKLTLEQSSTYDPGRISGGFFGEPLNLIDFRERIYSFVINLLLYMTSREAQVDRSVHPRRKGKGGRKAELRELTHPSDWILGSKVVIDPAIKMAVKESGGGVRWKLKYQVFVRGHWRSQPHGPGHTLRRQKWIEPYVKGKGKLPGPVLGHRYEDPGASQEPEENPVEHIAVDVDKSLGIETEPTLIEDEFDPRLLESGLYRAYSNTPAFPLLWGMTVTGNATLGGYKYHEGGVVEMLAGIDVIGEVTANPMVENAKWKAQVIVPQEAFTSVPEQEYGETTWQQMWWREVIQNAVDAGATAVDCNITQQDDGMWLASCKDNGHGMDAQAIVDRFFRVKASAKYGETSIGGLGEAKKFIALAWVAFRVRSLDANVQGTGEQWPDLEVEDGLELLRGSIVEVVMPMDKHTTEAAAIDFISKCYLPNVRFTVNGKPCRADLRAKTLKKKLEYGTEIFYDKSGSANAALVRVSGLYMFSKDLPSDFKGSIIIELHPKRDEFPYAKDLFNAPRMNFGAWRVAQPIQDFLQKARADVQEALRDPDELVRTEYEGIGQFSIDYMQVAEVRDAAGPLPTKQKGASLRMTEERQGELVRVVGTFYQQAHDKVAGDETRLIGVADEGIAAILAALDFRGESHLEAAAHQLVWKPDFLIMNDETLRNRFRIDKRFEPSTMTGPVLALAKCWAEFVRLIFVASGTRAQWGIGFVFSKEALGMYQSEISGKKYICLNPFDLETGKLLSVRDEKQLSQIFATAIHECAHYVDGCDYHSEGWRKAVDRLLGIMARYWPQAKRIASGIKVRGAVTPAKVRHEKVANQVKLMGEWIDRGTAADALMLFPMSNDYYKELSNQYLIPYDQLEVFLYDDEAVRFLGVAGSVDSEAAAKMMASSVDFGVTFEAPKEEFEALMEQTFSPISGIERYPGSQTSMPVRIRLRSDGLLQMRPADRKMTRYLMGVDHYDIPMSATIVVFADEGYSGQNVETLINAILEDTLKIKPGTEEGGNIKDTLAGGEAITIPYNSQLYMQLLRNYLEDIRLRRYFGIIECAPLGPDDIPTLGTFEIDVKIGYEDEIELKITQGSYRIWKWYRWVYDLPHGEVIKIKIEDEWEREKFLDLLPEPVRKTLETRGVATYEINVDFFERLLEFHLKRQKLDRAMATQLLGAKFERDVIVTAVGFGRNRDDVVAMVPALGEAKLNRLMEEFPESASWPVRYFVYPGSADMVTLADKGVITRLRDKGVANVDLVFPLVWQRLKDSFDDKSGEAWRPEDYMPVTFTYSMGFGEGSVRMAPADPRHVRYLENNLSLRKSQMVIVRRGEIDCKHLFEQAMMKTTADDALEKELWEKFWAGQHVLALYGWEDYVEELAEDGIKI